MSDKIDQANETIDIFDQVVRERDELRAEVERLNVEANRLAEQVFTVSNERDDLETEVERLRAALEWYATAETLVGWVSEIERDGGRRAREALAKPKEC